MCPQEELASWECEILIATLKVHSQNGANWFSTKSVTEAFNTEKLSNKLKDPRFSHSNTSLDKLVQIVTKHQQATDETEMLKNVLNKFIDPKELIEFITQYEKFLEY